MQTACGPTRWHARSKISRVLAASEPGAWQASVAANELEDLARKGTPPRFIYTEATYQNPTGTTIPRARRLEILALAKRFGVILVEDNCYGDVNYERSKPPKRDATG